ncbi:MAG: aminopeptidase P family protein [Candidatus Liptonbacteria bacterium]|nr:aminopeptidase P family protein [Candidatus Liptonbacteria bacterium]
MNQKRIERILAEVHSVGADAFLLFNHELSGQPGTQYLSGFSGTESVLLIAEKWKFIFTDGRYFSQAREECPDFELVPTSSSTKLTASQPSFWEELEKICRKLDLKKIVFDSVRTNYGQISRFKEKMGNISVTGVENILQKIRVVKDEAELEQIQKAVSIATKSFNELLPFIKEGATENELSWKLETLMRNNGAEKISFDLIIASGTNGAKPHAKTSDRKIQKGELVTLDFGCSFNGYVSDVSRTVAMGKISDKLAEIYETVKVAQELGCKAVKAGISGSEIDKICRDYISSKGYGEYFLHGTGHGVGMEVHELPYVSGVNKEPLQENSVITIEPGIYIEGIGGVRIEDTVVVKKDGSINMSGGLSNELIVL